VTDGPFDSAWFDGDHFYLTDRRPELIDALLPALLRTA
jgi:surfactin synthase thioesterase subunit